MSTQTFVETTNKHAAPVEELELQTIPQETEAVTVGSRLISEKTGLTRKNFLKVLAASVSFFFAGNNNGSLGALTPYILRTYNVGTEYVALIYGATFLGWLFAAATNSHLIHYFNLGAILTLGALIQVVAHTLRCWTPPFGLYVVTFFLQAAGMAYNESHANTFVASIDGAHRLLGFIHAMYALGCLIAPFVATAIAANLSDRWSLFYVYLVGIGILNVLAIATTFRDSLRPPEDTQSEVSASRTKTANHDIIATLKSPSVYLLSLFYFFMLGTGITAGGWVVEYLI